MDLLFFIATSYFVVLFMKETYKKTILQARARRLGMTISQTGPKGAAALKLVIVVTLTRPILMLFTKPIVVFLSLYVAVYFSAVYCFIVAFPIVSPANMGSLRVANKTDFRFSRLLLALALDPSFPSSATGSFINLMRGLLRNPIRTSKSFQRCDFTEP